MASVITRGLRGSIHPIKAKCIQNKLVESSRVVEGFIQTRFLFGLRQNRCSAFGNNETESNTGPKIFRDILRTSTKELWILDISKEKIPPDTVERIKRHKKKSPCKRGLSKICAQVLFSVGNTPHFTDYRYFHLSRILHIALNFLGDVET